MESATDQNFEEIVKYSKGYILADFWAEWCCSCRQMLPMVDKLEQELNKQVKLVKINIDEAPDTSELMEIRNLPALILFKDGEKISSLEGIQTQQKILEWINTFLKG